MSWRTDTIHCITFYAKTQLVKYIVKHFIHNTTALHPFNGLFSRTTRVNRNQKGKTSLDIHEARDDGVLDAVASTAPRPRQTTTATPHHSIFIGRTFFLTPNQRCQSTQGKTHYFKILAFKILHSANTVPSLL